MKGCSLMCFTAYYHACC